MQHADSVWLTDLRRARSGTAQWIPYAMDGREGHMIVLDEGDPAPVQLPSPVAGWCEIYLGFLGASSIQLRLAGEPHFRWLESTVRWGGQPDQGEEAFWRVGEVTPDGFELVPQLQARRADQRRSQLAYLRLVPLSAARARRRSTASRRRTTRTAGAVIDGHEALGAYCPQDPAAAAAQLQPIGDSDFRRIHFGCTCTTMRMVYPTQVGYYLGQEQSLAGLHSDTNRRCALSLQTAVRDGWDPVTVMIDFCRANGMEFWADFRIQQDYPLDYAGGFGHDFNAPFTQQHQDWRHVDRHGHVCSHLFSHFHPGWEEYKLALLAELAGKGPDGIHLNLMCELGALWDFAPQAVARFQDEYGKDPTAAAAPPDEWYQFRCDHLTAFMRRLRAQTDAIGARLGRRIPIGVQVSGQWAILQADGRTRAVSQNYLGGFDIGRWAREGLVDVISPSFRRTYKPMFLEHVLEELGPARAGVRLVPSLGQHDDAVFPRGYDWAVYFTDEGADRTDLVPFGELDAWRVLREAHDLYQQGADAVDVWEMGHAHVRPSRWNVLRRIGDRALLAREFGTRVSGLLPPPERSFTARLPD